MTESTGSDDQAIYNIATDENVVFTTVTTEQLTVNETAILSALQVGTNSTIAGSLNVAGQTSLSGGLDMSNTQVTGLADGTEDDHAVNLGQLNTVSNAADAAQSTADGNASDISTNTNNITSNTDSIADNANDIESVRDTAGAGWNVSANGEGGENVAPDGLVDFSGNGDIEVTRNNTDLVFSLADDITVESVAVGGMTLDEEGIDVGGSKVTNLANGDVSEASQDAVTGQQIHDLFFGEGSAEGVRYFHAYSSSPDSEALGEESIAIGPNTVSEGISSFAAGDGATTTETGEGAIAIGQSSVAGGATLGGAGAIAVGRDSHASGSSGVALGDGAVAAGGNATALGGSSQASGGNSIAIGDAQSESGNALAAGFGAYAGSPDGIALGTEAGVGTNGVAAGDKTSHIAIGNRAGQNVSGNQTTAIGYSAGSDVTGDQNVAIGSHAGQNLQGDRNVAIGHEANRDAGAVERATAVGGQTSAARDAVAVGYGAESEDSGVALGTNTTAGSLGIALGRHAQAEGASIALGSGSVALSIDGEGTGYLTGSRFDGAVVSVGATNSDGERRTRRIVNVADGSQSYDAVNVRQLRGSQEAVANLVGGNVTVDDGGSYSGYIIELQDTDGASHQPGLFMRPARKRR